MDRHLSQVILYNPYQLRPAYQLPGIFGSNLPLHLGWRWRSCRWALLSGRLRHSSLLCPIALNKGIICLATQTLTYQYYSQNYSPPSPSPHQYQHSPQGRSRDPRSTAEGPCPTANYHSSRSPPSPGQVTSIPGQIPLRPQNPPNPCLFES